MRLTYIWHDCFLLEFECCYILTDYFRSPTPPAEGEVPDFLRNLSPGKPLYILVSHHHKDHFSPEIFSWEKHLLNPHYILSRDTARASKQYLRPESAYKGRNKLSNPDLAKVLARGEEYSDNFLTVRAFGSTDTGCSYVISCEGLTLFFAGDLNAWVWRREDTAQSDRQMMGEYRHYIGEIAGEYPQIDIALFPLDYRLGEPYSEGAAYFVEKIRTRFFVPMHFELWEVERQRELFHDKAREFCQSLAEKGVRGVSLLKTGEYIDF